MTGLIGNSETGTFLGCLVMVDFVFICLKNSVSLDV